MFYFFFTRLSDSVHNNSRTWYTEQVSIILTNSTYLNESIRSISRAGMAELTVYHLPEGVVAQGSGCGLRCGDCSLMSYMFRSGEGCYLPKRRNGSSRNTDPDTAELWRRVSSYHFYHGSIFFHNVSVELFHQS